jgi:disulfide bond formation protein DsbB
MPLAALFPLHFQLTLPADRLCSRIFQKRFACASPKARIPVFSLKLAEIVKSMM